jgi:hypothetical protein
VAALLITVLRVTAGAFGVAIGLTVIALTAVSGDCLALGGTCPRDPSLDGHTFGSAALGAELAVGVPMFVSNPTRRRFASSVVTSLAAAVLVGPWWQRPPIQC